MFQHTNNIYINIWFTINKYYITQCVNMNKQVADLQILPNLKASTYFKSFIVKSALPFHQSINWTHFCPLVPYRTNLWADFLVTYHAWHFLLTPLLFEGICLSSTTQIGYNRQYGPYCPTTHNLDIKAVGPHNTICTD